MRTKERPAIRPSGSAGIAPLRAVALAVLACVAGGVQAQQAPDRQAAQSVQPVATQVAAIAPAPSPALAAPAAPVGQVVFAMGPARIVDAKGNSRAARSGDAIGQGERLYTGADGWMHVRMVDKAFVALRPESSLAVDLYEYDAAHPEASRIRLKLTEGNARTVSGKGGEAAKHQYRFNTPLAAIGLRGTDYTVLAGADSTRVSVSRGAVSVTPLRDGCSSDTLGPCATAGTRELAAGMPHAYLEVSTHNPRPNLVTPDEDPAGAARQNPSTRPTEPTADASKASSETNASTTTKDVAVAPIVTVGEVSAEKLVSAIDSERQMIWGRWSKWVQGEGAPALANLLGPEYEITVANEVFGLLRSTKGDIALPTQGWVDFNLANSEAYVVAGGVASAAQVERGSLNIDFRSRNFSTALAVGHAGGVEQLKAEGKIQAQGYLIADQARSNMRLQGALSRDASEAAYLFDKSIVGGSLLGAVRFTR